MKKQCDGVVYKITDLETGQFYIGETQRKNWDKGYMGSGTHWVNHCNKYPEHNYKREIIYDNIKDYNELYDLEVNEIRKYCAFKENKWMKTNNLMLNHKFSMQPDIAELIPCKKCGALRGHTKLCSQYIERKICPECGSRVYRHKKNCSKGKISTPCPECGSRRTHKKTCSKYNYRPCEKCGSIHGHLSTCPKVNNKCEPCSECNGKDGKHFKHCSKYKEFVCPECNCHSGHFKTCSKYTNRKVCPECGCVGHHLGTCSKTKGKCSECGYSLQSHKHAKSCSKYKELKSCSECGSRSTHKKTCSKYRSNYCSECGSRTKHKSWCPNKN